MILWCYFIWYLVVLVRYFDRSPVIWWTAAGLSLVVGFALYVNSAMSGRQRVRLGFWPVARMFMMPFCVSSYSALVKGRGFVLGIFSPNPWELLLAVGLCGVFCGMAMVAKAGR